MDKSNLEHDVSDPEQKALARALWYTGKGQAEIREEPLPSPRPHEVRVRALHSALSRGTEALVQSGAVPESEYERMRAPFMAGAFPFPVKYGYAMVGRIVQPGHSDDGRLVFSLFPHQDVFNAARDSVHWLPGDVSPMRGILAANMETALNAVWDSAAGPADRIAIVGAGVVGALVGFLCGKLPGANVTLVDTDPSRVAIAEAFGIAFALPGNAPSDCDVVFHASGNGQGLATAIECAGEEATIVEMSWYGDREVSVPLGGAFHSRRLKIVSSQVGQVSPSRRPRWTCHRRLDAALSLLADPKLDVLIAPAIPFDELPARLPSIFAPGSGVLCQPVNY